MESKTKSWFLSTESKTAVTYCLSEATYTLTERTSQHFGRSRGLTPALRYEGKPYQSSDSPSSRSILPKQTLQEPAIRCDSRTGPHHDDVSIRGYFRKKHYFPAGSRQRDFLARPRSAQEIRAHTLARVHNFAKFKGAVGAIG